MVGFKILEFKKSQYSYEAIEKALSEKVSEGWKVVSMHTVFLGDPQGIIVVLLQQIIPGDEENMSYIELLDKKTAELSLKKIQKEIDDLDLLPPGYTLNKYKDSLGPAVALGQTEAMMYSDTYENGAGNGLMGLGMMGVTDSNNATASQNSVQPHTGKFCTNCGAPMGTGKFCGNCGNPI